MPTTPNLGIFYWNPLDPASADIWGDDNNDAILDFDSEFATRTIAQNYADFNQSRMRMIDTSEVANDLGNVSGALAIDYELGQYQYGTVTGNITSVTVSNWPANGVGAWMTLELTQGGSGNYTITLSSAYEFPGGTQPVLSTAIGARDKLFLQTRTNGTTIDVFSALNMS